MTAKVITILLLAGLVLAWGIARMRVYAAENKSAAKDIAQRKAALPSAQVVTTSGDSKLSASRALDWKITTDETSEAAITIEQGKTKQAIVGFGGAFTDAACYMFDTLAPAKRQELFVDLFGKDGLNLNLCRAAMGASDYATHAYSYCDGDEPDPEMKRFSIAHDRKYILPMIREARAINPDIFLFASPWSPPGWMKSNKSMLGGNMQRQYMPAYALYFNRFLKDYAAEGAPVQAVTIQNEVDTDQDGRMPACAWPQEYEVDFVRHHLGPLLRKEGLDTQIWIIDHNYNLWGRALGSLDTDGLKQYVSAIAWHGYVGDAHKMSTVHDAYPDVDAYWTEGGPDYTDANYGKDWTKWSRTFTGNLRNWCRGITVWNLALDEQGRPNIGPFPCGGLVTIDSTTGAVSHSGQYYALAQFSRFVKRGARVVESTSAGGEIADIAHVAFVNPDGQMVVVVTNSGAARKIAIRLGDHQTELDCPADSVSTVTW